MEETFLTTARSLLRTAVLWVTPLALFPLSAFATEGSAHWEGAWVRSVPPGAVVAAAYGNLVNRGDTAVTVTAVTSSLGTTAQMHDTVANGDQRRMVHVHAKTLAPGGTLVFAPGGLHIMLMEFTEAPAEDDEIELCAVTLDNNALCTRAPVRRDAPVSSHHDSGHHH